jgi:hypothetical protein
VKFGDGYSGQGVTAACGWFVRVGNNLTFNMVPESTVCPDTVVSLSATTLVNFWVNSTVSPSDPVPGAPPSEKNSTQAALSTGAVVAIVLGAVVIVAGAVIAAVVFWRVRSAKARGSQTRDATDYEKDVSGLLSATAPATSLDMSVN